MAWSVISQTNLETGVTTRRFCHQGGEEGDYVELTEEQVDSLLNCLVKMPALSSGEQEEDTEQEIPQRLGELEVVSQPSSEAPVRETSSASTLRDLMAASKTMVDEDGFAQG